MQTGTTSVAATGIDADAVVLGLYSEGPLPGPARQVDEAAGGLITRLVEGKEISGKAYETFPMWGLAGTRAPQVLLVGLGDRGKLDRGVAFRASAAAARQLAAKKRKRVAFYLHDNWGLPLDEAGLAGAIVGCHGQDLYRAEKKRQPFDELLWSGGDAATIDSGRILGDSVNFARRLVNEPPQEIYPESFAQVASDVGGDAGLKVEVWDEDRLEQERASALLAVARGSSRPPRLVILRHQGGPSDSRPLALVGKGVTFDSGGLSLKPNESMLTMKCDMAGAATVLGAMRAIARLRLPVNVVGLMGLVENMPGGKAMKLGDVLRARSGRTIEVHNTDAEGRLVLADVLSVAVEMNAARIVDLATLTGSCVVALGHDVAGLMTNDSAWSDVVMSAARTCGEPLWPLPMFPEYSEQIKSEVADIKNVGEGRWGGAITAAKFLEEFVAGIPWAHLDIAGPAFLDSPRPWSDGGASGIFVRTLVELARTWKA